jgi:cytochrome c oxidase subunit 1
LATIDRPVSVDETPAPSAGIIDWLTTTDHKKIGVLYLVTSTTFFIISGALALIMRAELAVPGLQFLTDGQYNQLFTMHGTAMIFFFATAVVFALANYIVPLHIGAPDVAFPRLNAFTYWIYLFGALIAFSGFLTAGGAATFGWTFYAPLSNAQYTPQVGADLWIVGVALSGLSSTFGSINFLATIFGMRAPGMTMLRMSIFTWNMLVTMILVMFSFPALTAALILTFIDRNLGGHFFEAAQGGNAVLFQHIFWFFGHPEVYIVILPFFGTITEVIATFSRKPVFGYTGFVLATILIGAYSFSVWAHHMFATGVVSGPFFMATSFLIAVPTGIKFFNWIGTMWRGKLVFPTAMKFALGFLSMFLIGGITGMYLASPAIDYDVHDTYYVVAHFHYTLFGGSVFALFAGFYYWYPKIFGRMMNERLGTWQFWLTFIGFNVTFLPQFQLGFDGMVRRIADYPASTGWTDLNLLSSAGAGILGVAMTIFVWNFVTSMRNGKVAGPDPWGGYTLEWATSSPPPEHNFLRLPPIRSERPVWDQRMREMGREEKTTARQEGRE